MGNIEEDFERQEERKALLLAIKSLCERDRLFLTLYYYENLNYQEIAQVLGCKVANISNVHKKILKIFKECLKQNQVID